MKIEITTLDGAGLYALMASPDEMYLCHSNTMGKMWRGLRGHHTPCLHCLICCAILPSLHLTKRREEALVRLLTQSMSPVPAGVRIPGDRLRRGYCPEAYLDQQEAKQHAVRTYTRTDSHCSFASV